ncbi:MAG: class I SAM-dependent methyltransferase [Phycisphaerales bacterium]
MALAHFRAILTDFHHTGSVAPSSRAFARRMASALRTPQRNRKVLEVGPGDGPITREIVEWLTPGDRFDVVEINEDLAAALDRNVLQAARSRLPEVEINLIVGPVQEVALDGPYDAIISALPLNNFEPELVVEILERMESLLADGGEMCFFEYAYLRQLKQIFSTGSGRSRIRRISEIFDDFDKRPNTGREFVLWNLPPAMMRRMTVNPRS